MIRIFFKQIGYFLLATLVLITMPVWLPLFIVSGLGYSIAKLGEDLFHEFRN